MSIADDKKPRGPRVNAEQKADLANYMLAHANFAGGKFDGLMGAASAKRRWETLTEDLNKKGPSKTTIQWQKVWQDMKNRSKSKVNAIKTNHRKTGNSDNDAEQLTEMDMQVLSIIGSDAVEGIRGVRTNLPESIHELRQLMAGDNRSLKNPQKGIRVFDVYGINKNATSLAIDDGIATQHNTTHIHPIRTPSTHTSSTYESLINTHAIRSPLIHAPCTPNHSSPELLTNTQSTLSPLIHAPRTPSPQSQTHSIHKSVIHTPSRRTPPTHTHSPPYHSKHTANTKCRASKRSISNDKAATFKNLQAKQNEILETMSKTILLATENEQEKIEITREVLDVKKQKLAVDKEKLAVEKEKLAVEKEKLALKKQKLAVDDKLSQTLVQLLDHFLNQNV